MNELRQYPSSVLSKRLHDCLGWLLLALTHGYILEVSILESNTLLLSEILHPRGWVDTSKEHEESRRLIRSFRISCLFKIANLLMMTVYKNHEL